MSCTTNGSQRINSRKINRVEVLNLNFNKLITDVIKQDMESNQLCDFSIENRGVTHPLHKVVLAASSNFFKEYNPDLKSIETDFAPDSFKMVMAYLYTKSICIKPENIKDIYKIARFFKIEDLKTQCKTYRNTYNKQIERDCNTPTSSKSCIPFKDHVLDNNPDNRCPVSEIESKSQVEDLFIQDNCNPSEVKDIVDDQIIIADEQMDEIQSANERPSSQSSCEEFVNLSNEHVMQFLREITPPPGVNNYFLVEQIVAWLMRRDLTTRQSMAHKLFSLLDISKCILPDAIASSLGESSVNSSVNTGCGLVDLQVKQFHVRVAMFRESTTARRLVNLYGLTTIAEFNIPGDYRSEEKRLIDVDGDMARRANNMERVQNCGLEQLCVNDVVEDRFSDNYFDAEEDFHSPKKQPIVPNLDNINNNNNISNEFQSFDGNNTIDSLNNITIMDNVSALDGQTESKSCKENSPATVKHITNDLKTLLCIIKPDGVYDLNTGKQIFSCDLATTRVDSFVRVDYTYADRAGNDEITVTTVRAPGIWLAFDFTSRRLTRFDASTGTCTPCYYDPSLAQEEELAAPRDSERDNQLTEYSIAEEAFEDGTDIGRNCDFHEMCSPSVTCLPNGSVAFVGGWRHSRHLHSVYFYHPTCDIWIKGPQLPRGVSDHSAVLGEDGKLYVVGGDLVDGVSDDILCLSGERVMEPETIETEEMEAKSDEFDDKCGESKGGEKETANRKDVYCWEQCGYLSRRRSSHAAIAREGLIYIYGSTDGEEPTECFDPVSGQTAVMMNRNLPEIGFTKWLYDRQRDLLYFNEGHKIIAVNLNNNKIDSIHSDIDIKNACLALLDV